MIVTWRGRRTKRDGRKIHAEEPRELFRSQLSSHHVPIRALLFLSRDAAKHPSTYSHISHAKKRRYGVWYHTRYQWYSYHTPCHNFFTFSCAWSSHPNSTTSHQAVWYGNIKSQQRPLASSTRVAPPDQSTCH
mgnify:CR=1 FL=1